MVAVINIRDVECPIGVGKNINQSRMSLNENKLI